MLPPVLRVLLIICALLALFAVINRIKKAKVLVEDVIFWIVCAVLLVILAIFPDIAVRLSSLAGFMSPANFVYLVIIALLIWKVFTNSLEISNLKDRVNEMAQEVALEHIHKGEEEGTGAAAESAGTGAGAAAEGAGVKAAAEGSVVAAEGADAALGANSDTKAEGNSEKSEQE